MSIPQNIEISLIIPCLNEGETLEPCITKAKEALSAISDSFEIILADNGSVDGSQMIARRLGAKVVHVQARGYGCSAMAGIESSLGKYIFLIDADDRYEAKEFSRFINALRNGADLVQGCRLPSGGGRLEPKAMSRLNRWIATPLFSFLVRRWFKASIRDLFCGMRGFSRLAYDSWSLRCIGLEFGVEMVVKASLHNDRIEEVPVSYAADSRKSGKPHLRNINDAWRSLRFILISCPKWLFLIPGCVAIILGLIGGYAGYTNVSLFSVQFDVSTILLSGLIVILGYQAVLFAGFTVLFAINEQILPPDPKVVWWSRRINMERGFLFGLALLFGGVGFIVSAWLLWRSNDFGWMDNQLAMRRMIPGVTLTAIGFQTILSGAFMSILGMHRRPSQVQAPVVLNKEKPWLSVIMPIYQGGHHLDSALSSIAMQNDGDVEVILVDDGSTDSVKEVVEAWGDVISLKVIWRDRVGNWASNTNVGMAEAKGEWICFLHQDDMWCHGRMSAMRQLARKYPNVRMFAHPVNFINEKGWRIGRWKCPLPGRKELSPEFVIPRLVVQDFFGIMAPFFKRDLYQEVGGLNEDLWYHGDWEYWLRLVAAGPMVYVPELLASFRIHELSQTSVRTSNLEEVARQIDRVMDRTEILAKIPPEKKRQTEKLLEFHKTFYVFMLSIVHNKRQPLPVVIKAFFKIGPIGFVRYLYYSRVIERTLPRIGRSFRDY